MDVLALERVRPPGWDVDAAHILVNGRNLAELAAVVERAFAFDVVGLRAAASPDVEL
jgi:hypothetical protein